MKIIVSSKHLANQLDRIPVDYVSSVIIDKDRLLIFADDKSIEIQTKNYSVDEKEMNIHLRQVFQRWDFLYKVVSKIDETPILLTISKGVLKLELSF